LNPVSLVIVVLEDDRQRMFIYRFLKARGFGPHQLRIEGSPAGRGSAEAWVREALVREMRVYRSRQARTGLIVAIDADNYTVGERLHQLDEALKNNGMPTVAEDERIARLVPKRNIETWILCLNGLDVDETTDYKSSRNDWNDLTRNAAATLSEWNRGNIPVPASCIDSLRTGLKELERIRP